MAEKPASPCHNVLFHVHFIYYASTPTAHIIVATVTSLEQAHKRLTVASIPRVHLREREVPCICAMTW